MDMTGEQLIALPQQQVWEALNDPAILKARFSRGQTLDNTTRPIKPLVTQSRDPLRQPCSRLIRHVLLRIPQQFVSTLLKQLLGKFDRRGHRLVG